MASTFLLKINTPNNDVYEGQVEKVFLKNADGELEVLANHENMITSTIPSVTKFIDGQGKKKELFLSTAVVYVTKGEMTICSDAAEFPEEIDFERAEKARKRAAEKLKEPEKYDKIRDELSLLRACERLKLKR